MERLTYKGRTYGYTSRKTFKEVCARLAEYENTGLPPDVCAEYKKFEDEAVGNGVTFKRIVELMNAEAEGRLVALPCKEGAVDLIDRHAVWGKACKGCIRHGDNIGECYESEPCERLLAAFVSAPTIDPASLRPKGEWITEENGVVVCSNCGEEHEWIEYRASFCEDCGADMRGGEGNG